VIKLVKFFLLVVILLIVFLFFFPFFIDKEKVLSFVNQEIQSKFEQKVSYKDDIQVVFFPIPKISINEVRFFDSKANLSIIIDTLKVSSSWKSLLKFKPKINYVELVSPNIKYKKSNFSNLDDLRTLVANNYNSRLKKIDSILRKFEKLTISNGKLSIISKESKQTFKYINLIYKNHGSKEIQIKGSTNYQNLPSHISFDIESSDLKNVNFEIMQTFKENNKISISGNAILDNENLIIRGEAKSKFLNIEEMFILGNKLVFFVNHQKIFKIKTISESIDIKIDVAIEKIKFKTEFFQNTFFQIVSNGKTLKIVDLKSKLKNSEINSLINYEIMKRKISGFFSIDGLFLDEKFFGKTKYDIFGGLFDCSLNFHMNDISKDFTNFIRRLEIEGNFKSGSLKFKGIDFEKFAKKVDEADTFLKFANLIDQRNWSGFSKLESLKGKINISRGMLFLKDVETIQKNVKVNTNGEYNLINEKINLKNRVLVSTKKYNNLPDFGVNLSGNTKDYKISYDLNKIRDKLFSVGIKEILKDKKKIIIDPKSIKKLFKNNDNESINTEDILDLFLN